MESVNFVEKVCDGGIALGFVKLISFGLFLFLFLVVMFVFTLLMLITFWHKRSSSGL